MNYYNLYKVIIITMCLFSINEYKAQKDAPPPIEKIELITEKGIRYKFPENIEKMINKSLATKNNDLHIIRLTSTNDTTYTLIIYCVNNEKNGINSNSKLIKKTGRYYLFENSAIPIIFNTDYTFSTPGFVISHFCYKIVFNYNKNRNNKNGTILVEEN